MENIHWTKWHILLVSHYSTLELSHTDGSFILSLFLCLLHVVDTHLKIWSYEHPARENAPHLPSWARVTSLSIIFSKAAHLPSTFMTSFFFRAQYAIVSMCHIFIIHLSVETYLGCLHFLTVVNRAVLWMYAKKSCGWSYGRFTFRVFVCLALCFVFSILISRVAAAISILIKSQWGFLFLHIPSSFCCLSFHWSYLFWDWVEMKFQFVFAFISHNNLHEQRGFTGSGSGTGLVENVILPHFSGIFVFTNNYSPWAPRDLITYFYIAYKLRTVLNF